MSKFPKSLADAEVSDIELDQEEFVFHGERLTENRAEEIAETVFARSANLIPGGKSLSGPGKHSPVVQTRVSENTRTKLEAIASARGMSVSKLSRQVLDDFVKRETAAGEPADARQPRTAGKRARNTPHQRSND